MMRILALLPVFALLPACTPAPAQTAAADGAALYRQNCAACHQLDGSGSPNFAPAIADSAIVKAEEPGALVALTLSGIEAGAGQYEAGMPGFAHLDDATIARLLSFVRKRWGPGDVVTPAAIQESR